jgi:hypothetical protein
MSDCQCTAAGWCETYKKNQSARMVQICRGEVLTPEKCGAYRKNWADLRDGNARPAVPASPIRTDEAKELFGDSDPSLWGNQIKALTDAIGIPPCGGCDKRRQWLNKAHLWLKGNLA